MCVPPYRFQFACRSRSGIYPPEGPLSTTAAAWGRRTEMRPCRRKMRRAYGVSNRARIRNVSIPTRIARQGHNQQVWTEWLPHGIQPTDYAVERAGAVLATGDRSTRSRASIGAAVDWRTISCGRTSSWTGLGVFAKLPNQQACYLRTKRLHILTDAGQWRILVAGNRAVVEGHNREIHPEFAARGGAARASRRLPAIRRRRSKLWAAKSGKAGDRPAFQDRWWRRDLAPPDASSYGTLACSSACR